MVTAAQRTALQSKARAARPTPSRVAETVASTVSSKGQIVIPAALRRKYRLREGSTVVFREVDGHLAIDVDRISAVLALRGTLNFPLEETLHEERQQERAREDRER